MGRMVGQLQLSKTSTVLIASHSCANGKAGHHTLQQNIKNVSKARTFAFQMVHTEIQVVPNLSPKCKKAMELLPGVH